MKKLLLHILLLSYTVVLLKPVLPYVNDFIGHVFFYAHHMATVHYENGKYHVHYETAKNAREEKSDKTPFSSSKKDNGSNEYILTSAKQPVFCITIIDTRYHITTTPEIVSGTFQINYPPPRV